MKIRDQLNEVTVQAIRALRSHGIPIKEIERAIKETTGISQNKLDSLFDDVVAWNQAYYTELATMAKITMPEHIVSESDIAAIRRQTWSAFKNITGSMGFLESRSGRLVLLPPANAYQWELDRAVMKIQSGAISYNQAISESVKQLASSGLKTVEYESGHVDQIDVAIRRAVMTGVSQLCDKYTEQSMEYLGTQYCEVSAHAGARDKPGKNPWSSHKDWQGRVYYVSEHGEPDPLGKYPDLHDSTGFGEVDGLEGSNCRHRRYAWLEGISERTYTDEELANIDPPDFEYEGRTYSHYEATQKQREIERTVRKLKRLKAAYEAAGQSEDAQAANIKFRRLNKKYREFSKAANLRTQPDRMKVLYK